MNNIKLFRWVFTFIIVTLLLTACGSGQLLGPTITPAPTLTLTPTSTSIPTSTLTPTLTPTPTNTPIPSILIEENNSWPLEEMEFSKTASIDNQETTAKDKFEYLLLGFKVNSNSLPTSPNIPGTDKTDYSKIFVVDSKGDQFTAVSYTVSFTFTPTGLAWDSFSLAFGPIPDDRTDFRLYFNELAPIELNKPSAAAVLPQETVFSASTPQSSGSFSDDFSSNENGWDVFSESSNRGERTHEIVDGKYKITLKSLDGYLIDFIYIPVFQGDNFILTIDVTVIESTVTPGQMSLQFSLREEDGDDWKHYSFLLTDDGASDLEVWPTGGIEDIVSLWSHNANSQFALNKGETKTISVEMNGQDITASVNGHVVDSITDATIGSAGSISILLSLYESNETITIEFDNLSIQEIP